MKLNFHSACISIAFILISFQLTAQEADTIWTYKSTDDPGKPIPHLWKSEIPSSCPIGISANYSGILFTGRFSNYTKADTWYPSWASDGNMYSGWTDGTIGKMDFVWSARYKDAQTGQAKITGDDPMNLQIENLGITVSSALPYQGRYPCGSLVHNGIWYYGTYALHQPTEEIRAKFGWYILGPFLGFRWSTDYGHTWNESPHTGKNPIFSDPSFAEYDMDDGKTGQFVKMGAPHFVDFGKNMEHSPDKKAYLVGHGASEPDPNPRIANNSWNSGDEIYLSRVTPSIENINDASKYEFFGGYDKSGDAIWLNDYSKSKPIFKWNNKCGIVTMTYNPGQDNYLMCITHANKDTTSRESYDTYILESKSITGPWKIINYMKEFGRQAYFVNIPSKFISSDGLTMWLCYSANYMFNKDRNNPEFLANEKPKGSAYALSLHEIKLSKIEKELSYKNARAEKSGNIITVSSGKMERSWQVTGNGLRTIGLKDLSNKNSYLKNHIDNLSDWDLPGLIDSTSKAELTDFQIIINDDDGFTNKHIEVISTFLYPDAGLEIQHVIWVYSDAPGIRTQLRVKRNTAIPVDKLPFKEGERIDCGNRIAVPSARNEFLPLDFSKENVRRYWGYYNNPGGRHDPSRDMLKEEIVKGYPLFLPEDINWASGLSVEYNSGENGVCVVKESPKCVNEQSHYTGSFYSGPDGLSSTGWGLTPDEILTDRFRECWATWTILWSGGNDGMQLALKQFDRARYPVYQERDMFIQSNTWGPADPGGSQFTDKEYLMKEIPALANLGIDVMQIDDGWQSGGLSTGARDFTPRYENGWKDIKAEMDKHGLRFGLWVTAQLATAEEMKKNLDELGFIAWKADFDHLSNRDDYEARSKKYRDVLKHSWMKTQFSLCPEYDDPRYGWYYFKEYGSIYFQNIQESLPAHLTMVPYQVLRQHWLMSKYFNSNKLQVMLQNPKRVNPTRSDAPQHSHSYCFAMGVPFAPCFFQSGQYLDQDETVEMKAFISRFKKHQDKIFSCYTFPIGDLPDNQSWCGFQMINQDNPDYNYLLIFRELHNLETEKDMKLKMLSGKTIRIENIETGESSIETVADDGYVKFKIKSQADYLFLRYEIVR